MSGASASPGKVCVVCQNDVANLPRVKDPHGHYYCNPCYADARKKAEAQRPAPQPAMKRPAVSVRPAAPAPRAKVKLDGVPIAKVVDDDLVSLDDLDGFESSASSGPACPSCGGPMEPEAILCTGCGYNRTTGKHVSTGVGIPPAVKVVQSGRGLAVGSAAGAGIVNLIKQPWAFGVGMSAVFLLFYLAAEANSSLVAPYHLFVNGFGLVVGIWLLVVAFQDNVVQGLLCLFSCGLYAIYYCFARQENSHLKWGYAASILSAVLGYSLSGTAALSAFPDSHDASYSSDDPSVQSPLDTDAEDEEATDEDSMVDDESTEDEPPGTAADKPDSSQARKAPTKSPSKPQSKPTDRRGTRGGDSKSP